jgi:FkbM family methyltransferase
VRKVTVRQQNHADEERDSRLFKLLRRWLRGARGLRSKHGANLALDILAANGIDEFSVRRHDGRLVHLSTRDKVIAPAVIRLGSFDRAGMTTFTRLLTAAGRETSALTFVNVGANIGMACLNAYDSGFRRFIAIEPDPDNFRLLEKNLRDLPGSSTRLIQAAIGDRPGRALLHRNPTNMGAHSLVASVQGERAGASIEVRVESLSEMLEPGAPFVLFVDVEGFEPQVLRSGAAAIARDCQAVVLEITPARYAPADTKDLHDRLAAYASEVFMLPTGQRHPSREINGLMAKHRHGQFDIALLRAD